jgi:hypothetical protein
MKDPGRRDSRALAAVLPPWIAARVLVVGALALARFLVDELRPAISGAAARADEGLLGWDASWYASIAEHGYRDATNESVRFFPLVPGITRGLAAITPLDARGALVVVANAAAIFAGVLLYRLARLESGDDALARRTVWLLALAPPAYVLVMGYSEAVATALAVGCFLALRTRRWGWATVAGALAGLARPVGVLLVAPAAVEAARGWRATSTRVRRWRLAAVAAPAAGTGAFLAWVEVRFDDWLLPVRVQRRENLRGTFENPLTAVEGAFRELISGDRVGTGLHAISAIGLVALLFVVLRRWPPAYGAFAALMLLAGLSSSNLDSLERYALSTFPFLLAAAGLLTTDWLERLVLTLSAGAMVAYAVLVFLNAAVP